MHQHIWISLNFRKKLWKVVIKSEWRARLDMVISDNSSRHDKEQSLISPHQQVLSKYKTCHSGLTQNQYKLKGKSVFYGENLYD